MSLNIFSLVISDGAEGLALRLIEALATAVVARELAVQRAIVIFTPSAGPAFGSATRLPFSGPHSPDDSYNDKHA
jgi:hypothetical protein